MSLPLQVIDRLFERLIATYGQEFVNKYQGDLNQVKSVWAHELSGYASNLHAIAYGLEILPERAPNVIEFRNLCRKAPSSEVLALPEPKADPVRLRAELAKLAPILEAAKTQHVDHKAWAKHIISRHQSGEKLNPTSLRFAREALNLETA